MRSIGLRCAASLVKQRRHGYPRACDAQALRPGAVRVARRGCGDAGPTSSPTAWPARRRREALLPGAAQLADGSVILPGRPQAHAGGHAPDHRRLPAAARCCLLARRPLRRGHRRRLRRRAPAHRRHRRRPTARPRSSRTSTIRARPTTRTRRRCSTAWRSPRTARASTSPTAARSGARRQRARSSQALQHRRGLRHRRRRRRSSTQDRARSTSRSPARRRRRRACRRAWRSPPTRSCSTWPTRSTARWRSSTSTPGATLRHRDRAHARRSASAPTTSRSTRPSHTAFVSLWGGATPAAHVRRRRGAGRRRQPDGADADAAADRDRQGAPRQSSSSRGKLYVANADADTIVGIDRRRVTHGVDRRRPRSTHRACSARRPTRSPSTPARDRLYVANAGENAVQAFDLVDAWRRSGASPPPGTRRRWRCARRRHAGDRLGQGARRRPAPTTRRASNDYMQGTLQVVPRPIDARPRGRRRDGARQPRPARTRYEVPLTCTGTPRGASRCRRRQGAPTPIEHVFLIVRENKTYDAVLGDLAGRQRRRRAGAVRRRHHAQPARAGHALRQPRQLLLARRAVAAGPRVDHRQHRQRLHREGAGSPPGAAPRGRSARSPRRTRSSTSRMPAAPTPSGSTSTRPASPTTTTARS